MNSVEPVTNELTELSTTVREYFESENAAYRLNTEIFNLQDFVQPTMRAISEKPKMDSIYQKFFELSKVQPGLREKARQDGKASKRRSSTSGKWTEGLASCG
jgi:hypothetical protein